MFAPFPSSRSVRAEHTAWQSQQWHTVDCPGLEEATRRQAEAVESLPSFTHSWDVYQHLVSTLQTIQVRVHLTSCCLSWFKHVHDSVLQVCIYYMQVYACTCTYINHVCIYIHIHTYIHVRMYICIDGVQCMLYVHRYVCIYMHVCITTSRGVCCMYKYTIHVCTYMCVLAFGYGIVALKMCGQGTHVTNISSSSFIHSPFHSSTSLFHHSHIPASAHSPSG